MSKLRLQGVLERYGLHRPELRAWAMYDWANSAFYLVIITAVFPIYFQQVAAAELDANVATGRFAWTTTIALTVVAFVSPILGAVADYWAVKKKMLLGFLTLGVLATACMYFIEQGDWLYALMLFGLGNIGIAVSFVFYDSLLPHISSGHEMDRVSTAGYALGYLGSGLLLILNLLWIQNPTSWGMSDAGVAIRLSFLSVAVWWAVFSIPLFKRIPEPQRQVEIDELGATGGVRVPFQRLSETLKELRGNYRQAFKLLVAMLIYNDGIGTIIRMAAIYAATLELPQDQVIFAILLVQFVGIPFSFLFGRVAGWIGNKQAILIGLGVYTFISIFAYGIDTITEFYILALLVAAVQGGTQALSRSLFASMTPRHKTSEFFGFFSVFEKFAGILGPLIFSLMISFTGSSRGAILSIALFFVVGALLLFFVDANEGQRRARQAEQELVARTPNA